MRSSTRNKRGAIICLLLMTVLKRTAGFSASSTASPRFFLERDASIHRCGRPFGSFYTFTLSSRRWSRCHDRVNTRSITALRSSKNWDEILAQDEEDDGSLRSKIPADMKYNQRNCERSNKNFVAIKGAGGPAADLYGCATTSDEETVFWFLGKVAHVSDVSLEQCVARQWPLIQQHAVNLRPLDLFPAASSQSLQLWCAPADSEFDVAYSRPTVQFQKMERDVPGADAIKANLLGFQGEVYERGEEGFRAWRLTADGRPSRPEVMGVQEDDDEGEDASDSLATAPTDEEMERIQQALEGKDINELYEEQQRRKQATE